MVALTGLAGGITSSSSGSIICCLSAPSSTAESISKGSSSSDRRFGKAPFSGMREISPFQSFASSRRRTIWLSSEFLRFFFMVTGASSMPNVSVYSPLPSAFTAFFLGGNTCSKPISSKLYVSRRACCCTWAVCTFSVTVSTPLFMPLPTFSPMARMESFVATRKTISIAAPKKIYVPAGPNSFNEGYAGRAPSRPPPLKYIFP